MAKKLAIPRSSCESRTARLRSAFLWAYAEIPQRRRTVGYAEWWKLRVLLFILQHPRESYWTWDLRAHLAGLGLTVSSLDQRCFCARHGIRCDMRAATLARGMTRTPGLGWLRPR